MRRAVAIAMVLAALVVPAALADGDPASDYLIVRQVFLPFDAKVDKASADELTGLLAAAKKDGFELRVAVISTKTDLGAVPVLYGKPDVRALPRPGALLLVQARVVGGDAERLRGLPARCRPRA